MNKLWSVLIIVSITFSILTGGVKEINNIILTSSFEALKTYGLIASNIILWSGILDVCIDGGTMKYLTFFVKPVVRKLFRTKNEETLDCISANIACNIFALGSAATPFTIKALENLNIENGMKNEETKDMITLMIINCCGFTLLPLSLMSLRSNFDSTLNHFVLIYVISFSFLTTIIMLVINKVGRR